MEFDVILGNALRAALGPPAAIYAIAAIGLNIHFGYAGLLNFGQVGFVMLGAYGMSVSVATFDLSMWIGIPIGLLLCVAFALALGVPTLRLRADYFAITTIAAAEIIRRLIRSSHAVDLTGGPFDLSGVAGSFREDLNPIPAGRYGWGTFQFSAEQVWTLIWAWTVVIVLSALVYRLARSPWGRVLKSIREDEDAARSLGKNAVGYKMQALVLGGVIGGLAGVFDAIDQSGVSANNYQAQVTFFLYTALILGGAATRVGPVVGAMLFWLIQETVRTTVDQLAEQSWLPDFLTNFLDGNGSAIAIIVIGGVLMALMVFRPQGLFGNVQEMQLDAR
ncbi:MAG: branched-chain amino acid ABC transporter permease [Acidimicrobiales bacterium]|nr:branched-chain amino acid ABC transporter permease [Acidimicrobiales bacterium]